MGQNGLAAPWHCVRGSGRTIAGPLEIAPPDDRIYKRDLRRKQQKLPTWSREAARAAKAVATRSTAQEVNDQKAWFNYTEKKFDPLRKFLGKIPGLPKKQQQARMAARGQERKHLPFDTKFFHTDDVIGSVPDGARFKVLS